MSEYRLQYDTYERESRRYGGAHGITLAEQVFYDSIAIISLVSALAEGDAGTEGIDLMLTDFKLDLTAKEARFIRITSLTDAMIEFPRLGRPRMVRRFEGDSETIRLALSRNDEQMNITTLQMMRFEERSLHLRQLAASLHQFRSHGRY